MTHLISKLTLLPSSVLLVIACSHSSPAARQQEARENAQERMEERNEMAQEQREDRNEMVEDQREEHHEMVEDQREEQRTDQQGVAEANQNLNPEQGSFADDARGRLANLDARASKLQAKANIATGDKRRDANQALQTVTTDMQQINERINALPTMPADRMDPAKTEINDRLSLLDGKLDRVEIMLGS